MSQDRFSQRSIEDPTVPETSNTRQVLRGVGPSTDDFKGTQLTRGLIARAPKRQSSTRKEVAVLKGATPRVLHQVGYTRF